MEPILGYLAVGILFARCADKIHEGEDDVSLGQLFLIGAFWLPIVFTIALFGKKKGD